MLGRVFSIQPLVEREGEYRSCPSNIPIPIPLVRNIPIPIPPDIPIPIPLFWK